MSSEQHKDRVYKSLINSHTQRAYDTITFPYLDAYLAQQRTTGLVRQDTVPAMDPQWSMPKVPPGEPTPIPLRNEPHISILRDDVDLPTDDESDSDTSGSTEHNTKKKRSLYTAKELFTLANAAVQVNPWGALHGGKGKCWEEVAVRVKKEGAFLSASTETIKNKMNDLIEYQKVFDIFVPFFLI